MIFEMATPTLALGVTKRFQRYPCIIQACPLTFSRKADPKPSTQGKVITTYLDTPKVPVYYYLNISSNLDYGC